MNIRKKIKGKTPLMFEHFSKTPILKVLDKNVECSQYQTQSYPCRKFYKHISVFSI